MDACDPAGPAGLTVSAGRVHSSRRQSAPDFRIAFGQEDPSHRRLFTLDKLGKEEIVSRHERSLMPVDQRKMLENGP